MAGDRLFMEVIMGDVWTLKDAAGNVVANIDSDGVLTLSKKLSAASLNYSVIAVTVALGQTAGTGVVVAGAIVLGIYPAGNQDQFVDNVAIAGTTLTVTLAAAATAANAFKVVVLNA